MRWHARRLGTGPGLDPTNPADRNADRDGDGYTNLEEYLNHLCVPECWLFFHGRVGLRFAAAAGPAKSARWIGLVLFAFTGLAAARAEVPPLRYLLPSRFRGV